MYETAHSRTLGALLKVEGEKQGDMRVDGNYHYGIDFVPTRTSLVVLWSSATLSTSLFLLAKSADNTSVRVFAFSKMKRTSHGESESGGGKSISAR